MSNEIILEFIQALNEEIESIKRGKGGGIVKIFNGRFLRETAGLFLYVFNLENFLAVLEESPAEIEIKGKRYPAQVVLTRGLEVEIGIERFCGKFISEAKLQTNLWYLLDLLKKKYEEYLTGNLNINFGLSDTLFDGDWQRDNLTNTQLCTSDLTSIDITPNFKQKQAISAACSKKMSIIWGPPGTGKTETIARIADVHLHAGRRVLLVSHANNAVDEALLKVASHLKQTPFYIDGKLVRLGIPQKEFHEKMEKDYELLLLEKIVIKLSEPLIQERKKLEDKRYHIEDILKKLENAIQAVQKSNKLNSEYNEMLLAISKSSEQLKNTIYEIDQLEKYLKTKRDKLYEANSIGKIMRVIKRLNPQKIQNEINRTSIALNSKKQLAMETNSYLAKISKTCKEKKNEAEHAKSKTESLLIQLGMTGKELDDMKYSYEKENKSILSRLSEIDVRLNEIQKNILSEAKLVATTLTKTFSAKQFPDKSFDVLILDEASMAPLPYVYWAASKCSEFVIIIGDFLQLPPICISEKNLAQKWLNRSIFNVLKIEQPKVAIDDYRVNFLEYQHRMDPDISEIVNKLFYEGFLKDSYTSTVMRKKQYDGISKSSLVLIETSKMNPWCSRLSTGGRFNLYNALVCSSIAMKITQSENNKKIGIITPYAAQARLINRIIQDWKLNDYVRVSTVHRFQGGEEQIIIFDCVESLGTKIAPMLDDTKPNSDAKLLLNVAITRAKNRLYLIANTGYILSGLSKNSVLSEIINHLKNKAEIIISEKFIDNYFTDSFEKWAGKLLPEFKSGDYPSNLFTERNFWTHFFKDLKKVKERLIVLSPYITINRCQKLMDYLQVLCNRGVEVRIYTRPSNQQGGEMANQAELIIKKLREIGITVIERRSMHQKVAILDNALAWEGSLNILSHKDTGEHMRRFESSSIVEEIIRNLDLEEEMPPGYRTNEVCPLCGGFLIVRSKFGKKFLGCENYARKKCHFTSSLSASSMTSFQKERDLLF